MENCCGAAVVIGMRDASVGAEVGGGAWLGFSGVVGLVVIVWESVVGFAVVGWGLGEVGLGPGGTTSVGTTPENTYKNMAKHNFHCTRTENILRV